MGKKIYVSYFFMKNPFMKFQNPSMHGSEVMLCIKKRNRRRHACTKQYAPPTSSVGAIKIEPRSFLVLEEKIFTCFVVVFFPYMGYMGMMATLFNDAEPFEQFDNRPLTEGPI